MSAEPPGSPGSDPGSPSTTRGQFVLESTIPGAGRLDIDVNALQGISNDPDKAAVTTAQTAEWLQGNYHTNEDAGLPRNLLHHHYYCYCVAKRLTPVNGATFGKILRSVFPDMRVRRLGNRGQSRYHYCGIAPKETSPYYPDYMSYEAERIKRKCASTGLMPGEQELATLQAAANVTAARQDHTDTQQSAGMLGDQGDLLVDVTKPRGRDQVMADRARIQLQFPTRQFVSLPAQVTADEANSLLARYRVHVSEVLDWVARTDFAEVESAWFKFWQGLPEGSDRVLECAEVIDVIAMWDDIFCNAMLDLLLPCVTMPVQGSLTVAIRDFAKAMERGLAHAMAGRPNALLARRLEVASVYSSCLRGQTSLNHLAQAARAVMQNEDAVAQMVSDWGHVDFGDVEAQARWAFDDAGMDLLKNLYTGLSELLEEGPCLEDYVDWLGGLGGDTITDRNDLHLCVAELGTFMLRWSFLTALIIRDLTLRSAASFGHFHLLRLVFDEYILYMVDKYKRKLLTHELRQKALGSHHDTMLPAQQQGLSPNIQPGLFQMLG
eukprot:comp19712_c0_seq1/m.23461 comp19712_c0_seq1/g.23461  ORF comp19712_c0_seq1/g.23461 comp19712_c0_seq1/m.23461 type:complete len:550 (-) comp19712_c0_seq1:149-1798(-)